MPYPLKFHPILKQRVWGGRRLAERFGKRLPEDAPYGESWEISDRPGDVSVIANGPFAGKDLHWLLGEHGAAVCGSGHRVPDRFPWLVKILDAREKLSLQVHPPAHKAADLHGEPKTEMWYVAAADEGADFFVGLRRGVTREEFERRTADGTVAECFHRIEVHEGDCMFLPSGRVHALGGGNLIFEIQQNSDTTYRVFDWNRAGLDGRPRELHLEPSMAAIDFHDFEPDLVSTVERQTSFGQLRPLVDHPLFRVDWLRVSSGNVWRPELGHMQVIGVVKGRATVAGCGEAVPVESGEFCLLPAALSAVDIFPDGETELLHVQPGQGS